MRRTRGFTLIELLVTIMVLAALLVLAAPAMTDLIASNRMSGVANDLMADLAVARSEALKRSQRVVICKNSGNDSSCSTSVNWENGWLLYLDANSNTALDLGETLLRVRQAPSGVTVTSAGITDTVVVRPVGLATPTGSFKICDYRVGNFGRTVTVAASGRASVTPATCP